MKIYKLYLLNKDKKDEYENEVEDFEKYLENFVKESKYIYKYKYKIIFKNKIYSLKSLFQIKGNNIGKFEIKLICYNHIKNISEIFSNLPIFNSYKIEKFKKNMIMNKKINYLFYSSHEILKLIYNIDNEEKIKIFGEEFVGNNGNKCSIIYKDKIIPLQSYFLIEDINKKDRENKIFEILLLESEDISDRSYMFYECKSLVQLSTYEINYNEIKDNITEEENSLKYYYDDLDDIDEDIINNHINDLSKIELNYYDLEFHKIGKLTDLNNMSFMFSGCSSLISLPDISIWKTENVNNMSSIFFGCSSLKSLPDISKWNTNNTNDLSFMFSGCSSLISLPDISIWKTENVNNMSSIFYECLLLKSLPDISIWNTKNVNDMSFMFYGCSSLISLPDISKWNTKNVNNLSFMFSRCSTLKSLPDISKWNTKNVNNLSFMFFGCSLLNSLYDIPKDKSQIYNNKNTDSH